MVIRKGVLYFLGFCLFLSLFLVTFPLTSGVSSCTEACALGELCKVGTCTKVCSDGTFAGECSTRKPLLCTAQGELVNHITADAQGPACGCPSTKPIPLPSGYCGVRLNETASLAPDFSRGRFEHMALSANAFPNLALDKSASASGFRCPESLTGSDMTDGDAPLYRFLGITYYQSLCYIPNNVTNPYIEIDLRTQQTFDSATFYFGYPYILDYQILYSVDGTSWKTAYTGHTDFDFSDTTESSWYFGQYQDNDKGYMRVLQHRGTGSNWVYEVFFDQQKYQSVITPVSFQLVTGRYVRFVPRNWVERAAIYDIQLFNTNAHLQLAQEWDTANTQNRYKSTGSYESPVLFANVSRSDLRYGAIRWQVGTQQLTDKQTVKNWGPDALGGAMMQGFVHFDTDYGNDLGDRLYGYGGSSHAGLVPLTLPSSTGAGVSTTEGIGRTSLTLDGVDDYAWTGSDPLLRLTGNLSFSAWIKPNQGGPVFMKGMGGEVRVLDYALFATTTGTQGKLRFFFRGQWYETPETLALDTNWHQVGVTYDRSLTTLVLYLDGGEVYRATTVNGEYARTNLNIPYTSPLAGWATLDQEFKIGEYGRAVNWQTKYNFKGSIDEVMAYSRTLSASEMSTLHTTQRALLNTAGTVILPVSFNASLLAYWDFATQLPASSYQQYQYVQNAEVEAQWPGTKIPNRVAPFYNQVLSGSYPEAGYTTVAYAPRCLFDNKWAGEPTTTAGVPNLPCAYHPAETNFRAPLYGGDMGYAADLSSYNKKLLSYFGANTTEDSVKGKALSLDGIDDYMAFPTRLQDTGKLGQHLNLNLDDYSFSFWLKDPQYQWGRILSKGDVNTTGKPAYDILVNPQGNALALRLRDAANVVHVLDISYTNPSQWHHIVFTIKRSTGQLIGYVDGVEVGRTTKPISSGSLETIQPFIVGAAPVGWLNKGATFDLYKGKLDEVRLFNKVLSVSEIQQLAGERTSTTAVRITDHLAGHWSFDESSYVYMPEPISQTFGTYFTLPSGVTIDRIALNEVIDRVDSILVKRNTDGIIVGELSKRPTGKANTATFLDLSTPITEGGAYNLILSVPVTNDPHTRTPLVWEAGLLQTTPTGQATFTGTFTIGMQLRSAPSLALVSAAPWTGPDGTPNTYYTTAGQQIHQMHNGNQYYQYRISAQTPDTRYTPLIDNVSISYAGRINRAPVARLNNPGKFILNEERLLNASRSSDDDGIAQYAWDFGDGTAAIGTSSEVKHRYTQTGSYILTLTVTDTQGASDTLYLSDRSFEVEPFNCLTPDTYGSSEASLQSLGGATMQGYALEAVQEYATNHQLPDIRFVDTAEEYMDATIEYLNTHMSYLATRAQCFTANGGLPRWPVGFERIKAVTPSCGCPEGAAFCGNCIDYATAFTSLVRAMGVHSSCVYTAVTETDLPHQTNDATLHAYNIILYHGKYRLVEPQGSSLTAQFNTGALSWSNGEVPLYLTGYIYNDKQGVYERWDDPLASKQGYVASLISNYPGATGLPDTARQCEPSYYNLTTETQRLELVSDLLQFSRDAPSATPLTARQQIDARFMLLVGRSATDAEAVQITTPQNMPLYLTVVGDEFKQNFARFALNNPGATSSAFMTVPVSSYSTLLYHYMLGYPVTDRGTLYRANNAQRYATITDYAFYRSYYTGYDPLEVFADVCA